MIGRRSYTVGVTAHSAFAERPAEKPKAPDPHLLRLHQEGVQGRLRADAPGEDSEAASQETGGR